MNIIEAFTDPNLMGGSFYHDTREAWRAVLSGAFALPMDKDRERVFKRLSGERRPPHKRVRELWAIAGRRGDKTHTAAGIAVYMATIGAELDGTLERLSPGEWGAVLLLAVDRHQAKVAMQYITGLLEATPILKNMIIRNNADGILLENGVNIEVATNSHRSVRGRTLLAAILDEVAFYRDEASATPDIELYRALTPSLLTTGGLLVGISSPYARRGLLYDKWRKHYGKNHDDVLVVQGATADFNPTIDADIINRAIEDDPESAKAEYGGQFRDDVEQFLTREVVESLTRPGPTEYQFDRQHRYFAFTDPSGGGPDEFTLAVGHLENDMVIVDCLRGIRKQSPQVVVSEFAELLKSYFINEVIGDRYAGSWPADEFYKHGIRYLTAEDPKNSLYTNSLAAFNSGAVELPPDRVLTTQLINLERRTARGGRDSIDHPRGGHDDRANAVAGLIASAGKRRKRKIAGAW